MVAESTPRTMTAESNSKLNTGFVQAEVLKNCSFPAGLRVLVVDDDPICLLILDRMLRSCLYEVTCCERAIEALKLLREKKDGFDLVISDVYMPDMDGFKLLELVGLEMDLPVIMMSANGETSAVMKGIKHGACDYLLKPVRIEELKNIWQHVVRRKKKDSKRTGNLEDRQRLDDYSEYHTPASDGPDCASKQSKKRKDTEDEEEDTELDNDDPSTSKKPRVVWSVDLHQKFVNAVNQLGIDKAVPKRILDLMDVRGLTRENVASHLQKYRLYLKRISGLAHQAGSLGSSLSGVCEASFGAAGGGLGDLRAQLSPQVLVSMLPAGLLERLSSNNNFGVTGIDPSIVQRIAAMHGVNSGALVRPSYGPSLVNNSGSLHPAISSGLDLNHLSQGPNQIALFDNGLAGLSNLQQASAAASFGGMGHVSRLNDHSPASSSNNSLAMQILQQQTVSQMGSGQQILSCDMGARLPNGSSFSIGRGTGVASHFRSGQESSLSGPSFTPTNGLGSVRSVAVDIKNLNLSHGVTGSSSLPCNASSPSTSCGLVSGAIGIGQKGFASNATDSVPQSLREMVSNSPALSQVEASRLHMGLNDWQSCQSLGLSQESGQTVSPLWSPRYNQGFPSQAAQEQGSGRVSGFHDNFVDDRGLFKPLATTARSYNTQSRVESELKFKDSRFELQLGSKAGNGMMSNALSSSDDLLLSSYFKQQQQEVMGFTEGDLATEARTLGNMYVK